MMMEYFVVVEMRIEMRSKVYLFSSSVVEMRDDDDDDGADKKKYFYCVLMMTIKKKKKEKTNKVSRNLIFSLIFHTTQKYLLFL